MAPWARTGSALAFVFALAHGGIAAPAQTPDTKIAADQPTTIAVDARLVNLPVVVHDKKGALVQNLTKDDFSLQVDGHAQPIRYFDKDNNLPLTLGLLVDTSRSVAGVLDDERTASVGFLDGMLATSKDRAFVIQFAHQTELLQDITNSRPKLQAALKELDTDSGNAQNTGSDPDNSGGRRSRGGTTLYDAAFLAADELLSKQTGRKALILLTDGDDRGSKESLTSAIEAAQRANTVVYAIYFKGEQSRPANNGNPGGGGRRGGGIGFPGGGGYPGGGGGGGGSRGGGNGGGRGQDSHVDGKKILERMTGETGGRVFEISHKETVAVIYGQIADELRSQYRLGFTPDKDTAADGYHQVDLALPKSKNLSVQPATVTTPAGTPHPAPHRRPCKVARDSVIADPLSRFARNPWPVTRTTRRYPVVHSGSDAGRSLQCWLPSSSASSPPAHGSFAPTPMHPPGYPPAAYCLSLKTTPAHPVSSPALIRTSTPTSPMPRPTSPPR